MYVILQEEEILAYKKFRTIKPEIRVLGVDDGIFKPRTRGYVPVIGVVFRGGYWLDGVMHTKLGWTAPMPPGKSPR